MKLVVQGTLKQRTRINLILFTIAGPWHTTPISQTFEIPSDKSSTVKIANIPIDFTASAYVNNLGEVWVTLGIAGYGLSLGQLRSKVLTNSAEPQPFHAEPIKGVIVDGTVAVTG